MQWGQIKKSTGGFELNTPTTDSHDIKHLLTDSRLLKSPADTLFFAIAGKQNGHDFLVKLYENGVRFFIVEQEVDLDVIPDASVLQVEDSVKALQDVARLHLEELKLKTVGITGSNGKTTVKEWLSAILATEYSVIKTPKSYNSQIGVPLSVWNAGENHEVGVFEAGISQVGEMSRLEKVIKPQLGIFTSIGPAHASGFESQEQKIREKSDLFSHTQTIICCRDHAPVFKCLSQRFAENVLDWSLKDENARIFIAQNEKRFTLTVEGHATSFEIPFELGIWTENCLHAIIAALHLGLQPESIQKAINQLQPVKMRLSIKKGKNDCYLIDDTYNNDLNGLEVALDYLKRQNQREKKTLILSEFIDQGQNQTAIIKELKKMLEANDVSRLLLVGDWNRSLFNDWPTRLEFFETRDHLLNSTPAFDHEMILIKGARKFRFEEIVNRLSEKSHRTQLEINFESIIHNLNAYRQLLQPNTKMLAMVKAFGYGGGGAEISNLLQFHNIDYLGVAYTDEAIQLRNNGISKPIMVLNPDFDSSPEMAALGIEPEVFSLSTLGRIVQEEHPPAIHLKIETGMNRLGLQSEEWHMASEILRNNPQVRVAGIFTHLSSADEEKAEAFTRDQIQKFENAYQVISDAIGYRPLKHAVNSAGIIKYPEYHFDMVRLGIGLYGHDPVSLLDLRPVGRLITYVSQVKKVKEGAYVGYNRAGQVQHESEIAILPIGYADGYDRRFGNGTGTVIWNGIALPTIGNICMDMTMIDTLGHKVEEGDEVEIFGLNQSVSTLAAQIRTIPYEILTGVSERVVRIYRSE
jgi:alanine racemase